MYFKQMFFFILLYNVPLITSKKSFTIVLDTTMSMQEEIDILKSGLSAVFSNVDLDDVDNYILIPFKDPEVGPPQVFSSPSGVLSALHNVTVDGGRECPENSLAGIKAALNASLPGSFIAVFTDAYANDDSKLAAVQRLCHKSNSQVVIFLSGSCISSLGRQGNFDVYNEVASSCNGRLFQLKPQDLRQISHAMKGIIRDNKNEIVPKTKPTIDLSIPDPFDVLASNVRLACKVTGYPQPDISWKCDNRVLIQTEDIVTTNSSFYISYATINNSEFRENDVTVSCKATNSEGEDTKTLVLFNYRKFEVRKTPQDQSVEYGEEGKLYCEVEANPDVHIRWFHNNTLLDDNFGKIELLSRNQTMLIKSMDLNDIGEYKCEVSNEFEARTYSAKIDIFGLEAPHIERDQSKMIVKLGERAEISCVTTGKPTPEIKWNHVGNDAQAFETVPQGVYIDNEKLEIPVVTKEHSGTFRCEAYNALGQDYRDVTLEVQYAPIIHSAQNVLRIKEGNTVELECQVDAIPPAIVHWEMCQDDVLVAFDNRHTTDVNNTHRFEALWKDTGNYHCIADNVHGKAEKLVAVNVLVAPYIQPPEQKIITAKIGVSLTLTCNVLFGNPAPVTKWKFTSVDTSKIMIIRGNTTNNALHLSNVSKADEGSYICMADNEVGSDFIKISLKF